MKKIIWGSISILITFSVLTACSISSWSTYTNTAYGFSLQYPMGGTIQPGATDTAIRIQLPITLGTNLAEKYLDIAVQTGVPTCESPLAAGYTPAPTPTSLTINGLSWVRESDSEGAAGSLFDWTAYSTVSGSVCVVLTFVLHSHNPAIYATPPPTFDRAAESSVFVLIVDTFRWLGAGGAAVTPTRVTCATASLIAPSLLAPANGAVITDLDPTLTWQYPDTCVPQGYRVDLSVDPTFADTSLSGGTGNPSTSWGPAHPLADCTTYFWKVTAINDITLGPGSVVFSFRTNASGTCPPEATPTLVTCATASLIAPSLLAPANGAVITDLDPTLTWQYPDTCVPQGYRVDLSVDPTFADTSLSGGTGNPSTSWGPAHPLADCTPYFWKVTAINDITPGPGSVVFSFRTNASGTCPPELTPTPTTSPLIFAPQVAPLELNYQILTKDRVCLLKNPQVDISVMVSDPSIVQGVLLFLRLKNKTDGEETAWNNGLAMESLGNGNFDKSLSATQVPNLSSISSGGASAWLEYQFVATDSQGNAIGHSPVYSNVSLVPCG